MSDRYAVIGNPVEHSRSPYIHGDFARQTGQAMEYTRLLAPLDGFAAAVRDFRSAGARGANVTVPFKEEAFALCTRRSARAEAAGAVNTLSFEGTEIRGDNTDGIGLVRDIEHNLGYSIKGKRVLLLGAGGAARGVVLPLLECQPAQLTIVNRTADKARQLAARFGCTGGGYEDIGSAAFDLVINATSAGLQDGALPIAASVFASGALAYEMVYGRETPFMRLARTAGATVADGLGMLVEQAAEAFFIWRGVRPDTSPVLHALRAA